MRILLVHPEDSPRRGSWAQQRWDLLVDLGNSTAHTREIWQRQYSCPVLSAGCFRRPVTDAKQAREISLAGRGQLIDETGIDYWELFSILLLQDMLAAIAVQRLASEIPASAELWSTRPGGPVRWLESVLDAEARSFRRGWRKAKSAAGHYAGIMGQFWAAQIGEIFWDKYDPVYRRRSRFVSQEKPSEVPVVLIPSAYSNVSRVAAAYAALLPGQQFLLVATRRSGRQFTPPSNVTVRDLAAYAKGEPSAAKQADLLAAWPDLKQKLEGLGLFRLLGKAGVLRQIPRWIEDAVVLRNVWSGVLDREPVQGVLCGDDSNLYTRLPVELAAARKIPTLDFHHGAIDGFYLFKDLPCDLYLAKSEMERDFLLRLCELPAEKVVIAPSATQVSRRASDGSEGRAVVLFSEPYEVGRMRAEEVYRELLPPLFRVARENGKELVIKLHPFESRRQRTQMVREALPGEAAGKVRIVDGPLTAHLLSETWFGVTVESTTAIECTEHGRSCFLCRWLSLSPFGYAEQYARFGIGERLESAEEISEIPRRLAEFHRRPSAASRSTTIDPAVLQGWLTVGFQESRKTRSAS
jgi:hypothetical protein